MLQPTTDQRLVETWAASQVSPRTQTAYRQQGARLLERLGKSLADATVVDLQGYIAGLAGMAPATMGLPFRLLNSVRIRAPDRALSNSPDATLQAPPIKNVLAERILDEAGVRRMILGEASPRNRALLLFYGAGLRRAELCGLTWRDVTGGGLIAVRPRCSARAARQ